MSQFLVTESFFTNTNKPEDSKVRAYRAPLGKNDDNDVMTELVNIPYDEINSAPCVTVPDSYKKTAFLYRIDDDASARFTNEHVVGFNQHSDEFKSLHFAELGPGWSVPRTLQLLCSYRDVVAHGC